MRFDDRATNRQPHAQAAGLGRVERIEDLLGIGWRAPTSAALESSGQARHTYIFRHSLKPHSNNLLSNTSLSPLMGRQSQEHQSHDFSQYHTDLPAVILRRVERSGAQQENVWKPPSTTAPRGPWGGVCDKLVEALHIGRNPKTVKSMTSSPLIRQCITTSASWTHNS
jgi:hypothetical protein